jgi:hypothetical protein
MRLHCFGLLVALSLASCGAPTPNRATVNERFPSVVGESLEGVEIRVPEDLNSGMTVLLVGYKQRAQFDCDRWLLGLAQAETPVGVREIPTIDGMLPGMFSGTIDSGMRSGIPNEDWGSVVTVYGAGAAELVRFTGNENGGNARVMLLDDEGFVLWFHDRGYSATKLLELDLTIRGFSDSIQTDGDSK